MGYSVIAEFVIHHERMKDIAEALQIIKEWNPSYSLKFFMSDYSEELWLTPRFTYVCDFHREQSLE